MLNIFADALLIAARMDPLPQSDYRPHPAPDAERKVARRWFSLMGLKA